MNKWLGRLELVVILAVWVLAVPLMLAGFFWVYAAWFIETRDGNKVNEK